MLTIKKEIKFFFNKDIFSSIALNMGDINDNKRLITYLAT